MATKIRPIVFKVNEPEGFVMNASNATIESTQGDTVTKYISWESPAYPNGYDGNGKHYVLVNNNPNSELNAAYGLMYATVANGGGPAAISATDISVIGRSEGTMAANEAGTASGFGKYLTIPVSKSGGITQADVEAYLANLTITILDP